MDYPQINADFHGFSTLESALIGEILDFFTVFITLNAFVLPVLLLFSFVENFLDEGTALEYVISYQIVFSKGRYMSKRFYETPTAMFEARAKQSKERYKDIVSYKQNIAQAQKYQEYTWEDLKARKNPTTVAAMPQTTP